MLFAADHLHADDRMGMVRGGHNDRIDLALPVEHFPVILIALGIRILLEGLGGIAPVHIAEGDNIFLFAAGKVGFPHAAHAHGGQVELVARRGISRSAEDMAGHDGKSRCGRSRRSSEEGSPGQRGRITFLHWQYLLCNYDLLLGEEAKPRVKSSGRNAGSSRPACPVQIRNTLPIVITRMRKCQAAGMPSLRPGWSCSARLG